MQYQNQLPAEDYILLEESLSTMIECLLAAENEAMDPPACGLQVSH